MKSLVVRFDESGDGHCLYTEALDLTSIGSLAIVRASSIEFKQERQEWEVQVNGEVLYSNPSRNTCLEWEQQHFNQ